MSVLLYKNLEILKPYLNKKDIVEISINKPEEVWLETKNNGWITKRDKNLTLQKLTNLARILATESGQDFNDETPMLSLALPKYGYRLQIISGSAVGSGFALSIRVSAAIEIPLSAWFDDSQIKFLIESIKAKKNFLVSGATGSGKTTLLNSLLREIDTDDRIVTLEDSAELIIKQKNAVSLFKSKTGTDIAKLSYKDYINVIMRFRPDRILLGEIDMENALSFAKLINTGHDGVFTTVHADSAEMSIYALATNCLMSGVNGGREEITTFLNKQLDVLIFVKRDKNRNFKATIKTI